MEQQLIRQDIETRIDKAIMDVELSALDAHKKANVKAILTACKNQCSECKSYCQCCYCRWMAMLIKTGG